jgi:short-subunit dehydrogenase
LAKRKTYEKGFVTMMRKNRDVVIITGASSGIGKYLGSFLAEQGYKVYGTSRHPEHDKSVSDNEDVFFKVIKLDITDEKSVDAAINDVIIKEGKIDILINNAGSGLAGAIEDTSLDEMKRQFDVGLFGVHSMCRKVLPFMRSQGKGLIINIGSVAGLISLPFQSMYSSSKFALEAYTESLRIELKPHGIRATVVEPGDTKTSFSKNRLFSEQSKSVDSAYFDRFKKSIAVMENDEANAPGPQKVVKAIYSIINKKNPPVRKTIGVANIIFAILRRILPSSIGEFIVSKIYGFYQN